jgi:hypothetical protein
VLSKQQLTTDKIITALKRPTPPLTEEEAHYLIAYGLNMRIKIWSRVPMGLYTKNNYAGECQQ